MSEHRRFEDTGLGRISYLYPLLGGLAMALISIGGYIATLHYMAGNISKLTDAHIDQVAINAKLQTIIDQHTNDINDLKTWRDHMNQWNRNNGG